MAGKGIVDRILVNKVGVDQVKKMSDIAKMFFSRICVILYSVLREVLSDKETPE